MSTVSFLYNFISAFSYQIKQIYKISYREIIIFFLLPSLAFIIPKDVSSLCLTWTSSADDFIRSHCYWYVELSKGVSFFEADDICASNGGRLAPFVDSWQYSIIENMRPYTTYVFFFFFLEFFI